MFLDFFYVLRSKGIPCSTSEYLDLLSVLENEKFNLQDYDISKFYFLARNCLVKETKYFHHYDQAFSEVFTGLLNHDDEFRKKLQEWLNNKVDHKLSEERLKNAMKLLPQDLMEQLKKRLEDQKKRHDTGNNWIGTSGTSAFGNSGYNPAGVRIGGEGQMRSGMIVAGRPDYEEYRTDQTFNIRQIKVALKKLRDLKKTGRLDLNLEKTLKKTCEQMGELDLVFEKSRKNSMKLILLMDIGGSMTVFSNQVSQLFSSLHQINHFKNFEYFYFHNIFYDYLYKDSSFRVQISFEDILKKYDANTRVIIVGDAYMAPYELFDMTGSMREFYFTLDKNARGKEITGFERVQKWAKHFPKTAWLNPESKQVWKASTISAIRSCIKMYNLSIDGLEEAVKMLKM